MAENTPVVFKTYWVFPKIGGKPPKWMVKISNGKPYEQMDDLGVFPYFCWFNTHIQRVVFRWPVGSHPKIHPELIVPWKSTAMFEAAFHHMHLGISIWGVSKNRGGPSKSSILIGFSMIFTIHFGGFPPIFGRNPYVPWDWYIYLPKPSSLGVKWFLRGVNSPSIKV